jgi:hypothetical protein
MRATRQLRVGLWPSDRREMTTVVRPLPTHCVPLLSYMLTIPGTREDGKPHRVIDAHEICAIGQPKAATTDEVRMS